MILVSEGKIFFSLHDWLRNNLNKYKPAYFALSWLNVIVGGASLARGVFTLRGAGLFTAVYGWTVLVVSIPVLLMGVKMLVIRSRVSAKDIKRVGAILLMSGSLRLIAEFWSFINNVSS